MLLVLTWPKHQPLPLQGKHPRSSGGAWPCPPCPLSRTTGSGEQGGIWPPTPRQDRAPLRIRPPRLPRCDLEAGVGALEETGRASSTMASRLFTPDTQDGAGTRLNPPTRGERKLLPNRHAPRECEDGSLAHGTARPHHVAAPGRTGKCFHVEKQFVKLNPPYD